MSKKEKEIGNCALCGNYGPLCKSHIVPDFMYDLMFDGHEPREVLAVVDPEKDKQPFLRTGYYQRLLCSKCEGIFQKYEDYVARLALRIQEDTTSVGGSIHFTDIDYKALKLFMVSVLWRCSVSSRGVYSGISLGDYHESRMREMLLRGDTGKPKEYRCIVTKLDGKSISKVVLQPGYRQIDGIGLYVMIALGIEWSTIVSGRANFMAGLDLRSVCLTQNGEMRVRVRDFPDYKLKQFLLDHTTPKARERVIEMARRRGIDVLW